MTLFNSSSSSTSTGNFRQILRQDPSVQAARARENDPAHNGWDSLTGVPAQSLGRKMAEQWIATHGELEQSAKLLLFDLNKLHTANSELGHNTVNRMFQAIGRAFQAQTASDRFAWRDGGDEFGLLIATDDMRVARRAARRFDDDAYENFCDEIAAHPVEFKLDPMLAESHDPESEKVKAIARRYFGFSVGIASFECSTVEPRRQLFTVMKDGDETMYYKKALRKFDASYTLLRNAVAEAQAVGLAKTTDRVDLDWLKAHPPVLGNQHHALLDRMKKAFVDVALLAPRVGEAVLAQSEPWLQNVRRAGVPDRQDPNYEAFIRDMAWVAAKREVLGVDDPAVVFTDELLTNRDNFEVHQNNVGVWVSGQLAEFDDRCAVSYQPLGSQKVGLPMYSAKELGVDPASLGNER